jgi:hypothetical protein
MVAADSRVDMDRGYRSDVAGGRTTEVERSVQLATRRAGDIA